MSAAGAEAAPWYRDAYSLPLFPQDTVLRNPNGGVATYVTIYPDTRIAEDAVFDMWYSYSPITIPDISTMSFSVNGTPLESRILKIENAARSNWRVRIPANLFRPGPNELLIDVVHRTIDGLCRDIDNNANWFIIRPETRLNFVLEHAEYKLSSFPVPFVDHYNASKVNTVVYIPEEFDYETLSAVMTLGTLLGQHSLAGAFPSRLQVRIGEPGQADANEIVFGKPEDLPPEMNEAESIDIAPALTYQSLPEGRSRLLITASDTKDYAKAVDALSRPQFVRTFATNQIVLASPLPPATLDARTRLFRDKRGMFTLKDLGYDTDIEVAGAFHQDSIIDIPRPPNFRIGDGSFIELHFRHSRILDPKKSAVTIYINDIPIRAVALLPENADDGMLRAPIPESELNSPSWRVRFGFYHDLGIIDCSKRYDEVAWSVVKKETMIHLKRGNKAYTPTWENFPNDLYVNADGRVDVTMLMKEKQTQSDLTTAMLLSYYVGVYNTSRITWQVHDAEDYDPTKAPGTVVALGAHSDSLPWKSLENQLSIYPSGKSFKVADWLEIAPDGLKDFDIYQIDWLDGEKWLYSAMYKKNNGLNDLIALMLRGGNVLGGKLSLVDENGVVTPFLAEEKPTKAGKVLSWLETLQIHVKGTAAVYILVLVVVIGVTLLLTFLMRRRR